MPRYLLRLGYDGTGYVGWQRQLNGISVQQRLEEALVPLAPMPPVVVGAGRTDAGVHALGQAAHVDMPTAWEAGTLVRAINGRLPADIRVRCAVAVPDDFHARFSAVGKVYRYRWLVSGLGQPLLERDAWRVPLPLDLGAMRAAAGLLVGTHDFAAFQSTGTDVETTMRTIGRADLLTSSADEVRALGLTPGETRVDLVIAGTGFLRHMVRAIAGTLTEIGMGRSPADWMGALLAVRDRGQAGPTAPAHGLTLLEVEYGGTGGPEDGRTGGREDRRTGGPEDRRTGGQEDGRTGGREDRRTGGQEDGRLTAARDAGRSRNAATNARRMCGGYGDG